MSTTEGRESQPQTVVNVLLNVLNSQSTENVTLFYKDYHKYLSTNEVPVISLIKNRDGVPQIVTVNRLKAIEFLKKTYGFHTRSELRLEVDKKRRAKMKYNPLLGIFEPIQEGK